MDILAFGFAAFGLAILGMLVALVIGLRYAVSRSQERRYLARSARYGTRTTR